MTCFCDILFMIAGLTPFTSQYLLSGFLRAVNRGVSGDRPAIHINTTAVEQFSTLDGPAIRLGPKRTDFKRSFSAARRRRPLPTELCVLAVTEGDLPRRRTGLNSTVFYTEQRDGAVFDRLPSVV